MSRDVGSPFPGEDEGSRARTKALTLIDTMKRDYRNMSNDELDEFSTTMMEHFLDNTSAQATAKTILTTRGI